MANKARDYDQELWRLMDSLAESVMELPEDDNQDGQANGFEHASESAEEVRRTLLDGLKPRQQSEPLIGERPSMDGAGAQRGAVQSAQPPRFSPKQTVRVQFRPDLIGSIEDAPKRIAGEYWYVVRFGPQRVGKYAEDDLAAYEGTSDTVEAMLFGQQYGGRDALTKLITHLKLSLALRSQIYALDASRTDFYAYQFKPVLKFLESRSHRILIADEVGLGKTIESGLILTELRQRVQLKRVLIVPPSHLVSKWREEMRRRFDLDFEPLDTKGALNFLKRYEEDGDETELRAIVSLQSLRSQRLQERWEEIAPELDLVIFDEAARLRNGGTQSHAAARRIVDGADGVLLLTATPVQTGTSDLFNLLQLLDRDEFSTFDVFQARLNANETVLTALGALRAGQPPADCARILRQVEGSQFAQRFSDNPLYREVLERLDSLTTFDRATSVELQRDLNGLNVLGHVLSRTHKREVHEAKVIRRPSLRTIDPAPVEAKFYELVTKACREAFQTKGLLGSFATMQPQRQVASCMVAMIDYTLGDDAGPLGDDGDFDPEDFESTEQQPQPKLDWRKRLGDLRTWRKGLYKADSKWKEFRYVLDNLEAEEHHAKVVVFAFFKKTLRYLESRLSELGISCVRLDGDVPSIPEDPERDPRTQIIEKFRSDPDVRVLLSSEVGDEGIDLQFAHVLVNYDLPWNPMKVEQRIGRLDRLGQNSPVVTIVNLSIRGTIEDRILDRLYHRIEIFKRSVGDLEGILGEEIPKLERDLFARNLTPAEEERRIDHTAEVLERKRQELERFERDAEALIGNDEFFLEEVDRARRLGRYVGGTELLLYLRDFLREHHRSCVIRDIAPGIFNLRVNDNLVSFVRERISAKDYGLRVFLRRCATQELRFTIEREIAQKRRELEFLTFHHPLIRAVKAYYDEHRAELHPVSYVRIRSGKISRGAYVWFLYEIGITGARPIKDLEAVMISDATSEPLSTDDSEDLLSLMITEASSVGTGQRRRTKPVEPEIYEKSEETLIKRLQERFRERQRANDALVNNRLASLREGFERNMRQREERLRLAHERTRRESYIRGLETGLKNLESSHKAKLEETERLRVLTREFRLHAAGVVEVING